jgi:hypothetical protein
MVRSPLPRILIKRNACADRDRASVNVAIANVPTISSLRIAAPGEGHALLKRGRCQQATKKRPQPGGGAEAVLGLECRGRPGTVAAICSASPAAHTGCGHRLGDHFKPQCSGGSTSPMVSDIRTGFHTRKRAVHQTPTRAVPHAPEPPCHQQRPPARHPSVRKFRCSICPWSFS